MKDGSAGKEGARERTPGGKYRCPYCRGAIETPRGKCPACGKMLRPPDCAPGAAGRRERRRKIGLIKKDAERQKAALGGFAPSGRRSPLFYLAVISGLAVLGVAFMNAMRRAGSGPAGEDRKIVRAMRGADTIAEALGRFKFHNGEYPLEQGAEGLSRHDGIAALVEKEPVRYPKSRGPYLKARRWIPGENGERSVPAPIEDPWGRPYEYALSTNGTPSVTSFLGALHETRHNSQAYAAGGADRGRQRRGDISVAARRRVRAWRRPAGARGGAVALQAAQGAGRRRCGRRNGFRDAAGRPRRAR